MQHLSIAISVQHSHCAGIRDTKRSISKEQIAGSTTRGIGFVVLVENKVDIEAMLYTSGDCFYRATQRCLERAARVLAMVRGLRAVVAMVTAMFNREP